MTSAVEAQSAKDGFAVTTDDSAANIADALYVGTGGDVVVVTPRGTTLTFSNVQDGSILPVSVIKVKSTDTTASDIVGLLY